MPSPPLFIETEAQRLNDFHKVKELIGISHNPFFHSIEDEFHSMLQDGERIRQKIGSASLKLAKH